MKTITIFIAGSTILQTQRTSIKALATDLNSEFEQKGVHLSVYSYELLKDNQKTYNEFITENADIVLFIIDGKVGDKTKAEFDLALHSNGTKGRPRILVFIHKLNELSPEIAHFQGFVEAATGGYCITYNDNADLAKQAEIRLRRYIKNLPDEAPAKESSDKTPKKATEETKPANPAPKNFNKLIFLPLILAVLVIIGLLVYIFVPRDHDTLIIAGGGSAANHVENVSDIQLQKYPDACYIHMPSGSAWQLLTEEVVSNPNSGNQHYIPVCVSASAASDSSFLSNIVTASKFTTRASVISFNMGDDPLVVYVEPTDKLKGMLANEIGNEKITVGKLAEIVKTYKDSINILPTGPQSGTRKKYDSLLLPQGADLTTTGLTYTEIADHDHLIRGGKPFIVLGTAAYYPIFFKEPKFQPKPIALTVVDNDSRPIGKPVYLYCLAYVVSGNELRFPDITKKLLLDLKQDTISDFAPLLNAPTFMRKDAGKVILTPSELYPRTSLPE